MKTYHIANNWGAKFKYIVRFGINGDYSSKAFLFKEEQNDFIKELQDQGYKTEEV